MRYPDIEYHGAKDGVTGSCHQLHMDASHSVLVDCGLFQGSETSNDGRAATERLDIEFSLATVQALVVTHVHIDHVGRIPICLLSASKARFFPLSLRLNYCLSFVLEDAFKLVEQRCVLCLTAHTEGDQAARGAYRGTALPTYQGALMWSLTLLSRRPKRPDSSCTPGNRHRRQRHAFRLVHRQLPLGHAVRLQAGLAVRRVRPEARKAMSLSASAGAAAMWSLMPALRCPR